MRFHAADPLNEWDRSSGLEHARLFRGMSSKIVHERWRQAIIWLQANFLESRPNGDGAAILAFLMPVFVDLMMDNSGKDWGKPFYPVVT